MLFFAGLASSLQGQLKNSIGRLNAMFAFKDTQKVDCAEFYNFVAFTDNDAAQDSAFFAQEDALLSCA